MEGAKRSVIVLFLFVLQLYVCKANNPGIYRAYVEGDMQRWKTIMDSMVSAGFSSPAELAGMINIEYGYIGWCLGTDRKAEARKYLEIAEKHLGKLEQHKEFTSLVLSYRSAFYGYRIGLNRMLAPVLGRQSYESARKAIATDSNNPFAHIQYGNIMFYVPAIFGGSKAEALKYYLKAKELMEKSGHSVNDDWNYLNLLTLIARTYTYLDDYPSAIRYLYDILRKEPDFKWVKEELYPEVINKTKK